MIDDKIKAKIIDYYNKNKANQGVMSDIVEKFNVSKSSIYKILKEAEKDGKQKLIDYYRDSKNKHEAIRELSESFYLSESAIREILENEGLTVPIEIQKAKEIKLLSENEKTTTVEGITQKLVEYGFKKSPELNRKAQLIKHVQNKVGLDFFSAFEDYLFELVESTESEQLSKDLSNIKQGYNVFNEKKKLENELELLKLQLIKQAVETITQEPENKILSTEEIEREEKKRRAERLEQDRQALDILMYLNNPTAFMMSKMMAELEPQLLKMLFNKFYKKRDYR